MSFKRIASVLCIALCASAYSLSFDIGAKVPIALGVNLSGNAAGVWPGLICGGGITAECRFLEDALFKGSAFSTELYGLFNFSRYVLPAGYFAGSAYINEYNIRYGVNIRLYLNSLFFGIGTTLIYTFGGNYGDATGYTTNFSSQLTGHTIGVSVSGGYAFEMIPGFLFLPLEAAIMYFPSVRNTVSMEIGISIGCVIRIPPSGGRALDEREKADAGRFEEGAASFNEHEYVKAIDLWSSITNGSSYYAKAQDSIAKAKASAEMFYQPEQVIALIKGLIQQKNTAKAIRILEEALRRNPGNKDIRQMLTMLKSKNITILNDAAGK